MSLLLINILLIAFGLWLIVGGLYGLAVACGLPRRRRPAGRPMARTARWAVV